MAGPELSIDALVCEGRVTICGVADRDIHFPPFFVEMGHTLPSALPTAVVADATEVFCAAVAAVGIRNGAAKGDIIIPPRGAKIGEVAARLSGGYMSGWTYPYATGVDLTGAGLEIAVGGPAPDLEGHLEPRWRHVSAERAFLSIPGSVHSLEGAEEARRLGSVRDLFLRVGGGDHVDLPTSNVEKCGNAIACDPDRDVAVEAALAATQTVVVRLASANDRTDAFLFGDDQRAGAFGDAGHHLLSKLDAERRLRLPRAHATANDVVSVVAHPQLMESDLRDWHGLRLTAAAHRALELGRGRLVAPSAAASAGSQTTCIDHCFWRALLRGSLQGALYALDRVRVPGAGSANRCAA